MGSSGEGSGEIQTCFRRGVGVPLFGLQLGFLRWVQQRRRRSREAAAGGRLLGGEGGGEQTQRTRAKWVDTAGEPGLVEGEQGPEAGVRCRPGLVVQLSGPAPVVAMS